MKNKINNLLTKVFGADKKPERSPKIDRYFRVHNWMCQMRLSGYEILIYAFIYSYSRQGKGFCYRTEVMGGIFGLNAEVMDKIIYSLMAKNLLKKDEKGMYYAKRK